MFERACSVTGPRRGIAQQILARGGHSACWDWISSRRFVQSFAQNQDPSTVRARASASHRAAWAVQHRSGHPATPASSDGRETAARIAPRALKAPHRCQNPSAQKVPNPERCSGIARHRAPLSGRPREPTPWGPEMRSQLRVSSSFSSFISASGPMAVSMQSAACA